MDRRRKIVEWIKGHKLVSSVLTGLLIVGFVTGNHLVRASQGGLSEAPKSESLVNAVDGIGTVRPSTKKVTLKC